MATATGAVLIVLAPASGLALSGWVIVGLGVATVAPITLAAAPAVMQTPAPAAIAAVTTIGYLGSFTGPPLIGAIAALTNLSAALALLVAAGAAISWIAPRALDPKQS